MSSTLAVLMGVFLFGRTVKSQHVYTDSFPTYDQFDYTILGTDTVYGSPYGGFSRATRSRLAALPLHLPESADSVPVGDDDDDGKNYYEVRDGQGRRFVCRTYHEDELEPSSLSDSMFDMAIERDLTGPDVQKDGKNKGPSVSSSSQMTDPQYNQGDGSTPETEVAGGANDAPVSHPSGESSTGAQSAENKIEAALSKLSGVCAQIHKGWWSYEWCYGNHVTQFHVHVDAQVSQSGSTSRITVQSPTKIGDFIERHIEVAPEDEVTVDGKSRLGKVVEIFDNGDICPDTGQPRNIHVELRCCSDGVMDGRTKAGILYKGHAMVSDIAGIFALSEDQHKVCNYAAIVCTPLLCVGGAEQYGEDLLPITGKADASQPERSQRKVRPRRENESIRETLDRLLTDFCLKSNTGGWWVYEFCYGRHIRQFHEATVMDVVTGVSSKVVEKEHKLGVYSTDLEGFPNEEEPDHVVNITDGLEGKRGRDRKTGAKMHGGNGAFFAQEWGGGEVCGDSDVTEAAIKAGNVGEGGIERSTTVRFSCGPELALGRVNEDSTCHYVVDVTVPDLCDHPLFKAPVLKKQIVKCLPVDP